MRTKITKEFMENRTGKYRARVETAKNLYNRKAFNKIDLEDMVMEKEFNLEDYEVEVEHTNERMFTFTDVPCHEIADISEGLIEMMDADEYSLSNFYAYDINEYGVYNEVVYTFMRQTNDKVHQ